MLVGSATALAFLLSPCRVSSRRMRWEQIKDNNCKLYPQSKSGDLHPFRRKRKHETGQVSSSAILAFALFSSASFSYRTTTGLWLHRLHPVRAARRGAAASCATPARKG